MVCLIILNFNQQIAKGYFSLVLAQCALVYRMFSIATRGGKEQLLHGSPSPRTTLLLLGYFWIPFVRNLLILLIVGERRAEIVPLSLYPSL